MTRRQPPLPLWGTETGFVPPEANPLLAELRDQMPDDAQHAAVSRFCGGCCIQTFAKGPALRRGCWQQTCLPVPRWVLHDTHSWAVMELSCEVAITKDFKS